MGHKKTGAFFLLVLFLRWLNAVLTNMIGKWNEVGIFIKRTLCRRLGEASSHLYLLLIIVYCYNEIEIRN